MEEEEGLSEEVKLALGKLEDEWKNVQKTREWKNVQKAIENIEDWQEREQERELAKQWVFDMVVGDHYIKFPGRTEEPWWKDFEPCKLTWLSSREDGDGMSNTINVEATAIKKKTQEAITYCLSTGSNGETMEDAKNMALQGLREFILEYHHVDENGSFTPSPKKDKNKNNKN